MGSHTTVWKKAKELWPLLWPHGDDTWPELSFGVIIGCNTISVEITQKEKARKGRNTNNDPGAMHLLKRKSSYLNQCTYCQCNLDSKVQSAVPKNTGKMR